MQRRKFSTLATAGHIVRQVAGLPAGVSWFAAAGCAVLVCTSGQTLAQSEAEQEKQKQIQQEAEQAQQRAKEEAEAAGQGAGDPKAAAELREKFESRRKEIEAQRRAAAGGGEQQRVGTFRGQQQKEQPPGGPRGPNGVQQPSSGATLGGAQPGAPGQPGATVTTPQPNAAPGDINAAIEAAGGGLKDNLFTFSAFSEPVDLTVLAQFVFEQLEVQWFSVDNGLVGQKVVLPAPITLPVDQVMPFLIRLLEEKNYTISQDETGIYVVRPVAGLLAAFGPHALNPTQIIYTPGIRPSSLGQPIQALVAGNRGAAPGGGIQFLDELGLILMTDSPRAVQLVRDLVDRIVAERDSLQFQRFDLRNIAASSARDRVLELTGGRAASGGQQPVQPGVPQQPGFGAGGSLSNLPDRLLVDVTTNALLFRGRADEGRYLAELLTMVDVPNQLLVRWYPVGSSTAEAVSTEGERLQLGSTEVFTASDGGGGGGGAGGRGGVIPQPVPGQPGFPGAASGQQRLAGAGFVLYTDSGGFIYRGTESQHERVQQLIAQLDGISSREQVIFEFYKLKHAKAIYVEETITNMIAAASGAGNRSPLLRDLGNRDRSRDARDRNSRNRARENPEQPPAAAGAAGSSGGEIGELGGENVQVTADEPTNQVIVKAPKRLQAEFRKLIDRLDLRRPQVYIEAQVVVVTDSDDFRFAAEVQQIIGQFALNTNFGLGSLTRGSGTTATGGITSRKIVDAGLSGITAALIRSKDVPIVINAINEQTDSRIVAAPQLLVNDNEEATISSIEEQPTATTTQGTSTTDTSFGGFEQAGPELTVTPQISEGGYVRLDYDIELSSFTGSSETPNLPPPRSTNTVSSSVTVPSDMTIVVGGLSFQTTAKTVLKIPLLGDIPLVGLLFRDTSETKRKTTLYVFITPKIMRDSDFLDNRLNTGPALRGARIGEAVPPPEPVRMEISDPANRRPAAPSQELIDGDPGQSARRGTPGRPMTPVRGQDDQPPAAALARRDDR